MEAYEASVKCGDFEGAVGILRDLCTANNGALQIDMSSYEKVDGSYHAVTYEMSASHGEVSITKVSYEGDDFDRDPSSVERFSIDSMVSYIKERYDERFSILQNSFVAKTLAENDKWSDERVRALAGNIVARMIEKEGFLNTTVGPPSKPIAGLTAAYNDHNDKEDDDREP